MKALVGAAVAAILLTGSPVGRRLDPPTSEQCQFVREATEVES